MNPDQSRTAGEMAETEPPAPSFAEAVRVWMRVGLLSFGGPAGQIAVMHRILVEEKGWISEQRFLHALNFCMLLPGPEAQQLAIYMGWILHRVRGGLAAGGLFVLPGFIALMVLSVIYALWGNTGPVAAIFFGVKAAVLAIVLQALIRLGGRTLRNAALMALSAAAFVLIFFFSAPFPAIVLGAGLIGYIGARAGRPEFLMPAHHGGAAEAANTETPEAGMETNGARATRAGMRALRTAAPFLILWLAPLALLLALLGPEDVFSRIALFFSGAAVVSFGGAYAVLAWVAQGAVETYGWLSPSEMLDGLGMAETTPGPLIMVLQFVGFLGAYRDPGGLSPLLAGALGATLAVWVTFLPSFLFVFTGAPLMERLRGARALSGALAAITAAVIGVILNLAVWFAIHAVFAETETVTAGPLRFDAPVWASADPWALLLSAAAMLAVLRFRLGMAWTLAGAALAGLALHAAGLIG